MNVWNKNEPHISRISEIIDSEIVCLSIAGLVSEKPIAVNVLTSPQKLLQYAEKNFYSAFLSFWAKLS